MKKYSKLTYVVALIVAAITTACSDDFGSKEIPQEELYTRAFIKEFGIFDANHTWCAATPTQITINPQTLLGDVKVYSRTDGKYYYVAHYTDVYKTTTITFDAPRGTTDLKLVIDGTTYYAQANTTLTVSGSSRTVYTGSKDDRGNTDPYFTISVNSTPFYFNSARMKPILSKTTWEFEGVSKSSGIIPEGDTSNRYREEVKLDFMFTTPDPNDPPITVYPMYWNTNQTHTLGIYYYEGDDIVKIPIYRDKDYGDDCQLLYSNANPVLYWGPTISYKSSNTELTEWQQTLLAAMNTAYDTILTNKGTVSSDDLLDAIWETLYQLVLNNEGVYVARSGKDEYENDAQCYLNIYGRDNYSLQYVYSTSAAGYIHMTESLATEYADYQPYDPAGGNRITEEYASQGIVISCNTAGKQFGMYLDLDKAALGLDDDDDVTVYSEAHFNLTDSQIETEKANYKTEYGSDPTDEQFEAYLATTEKVQKYSYACTFVHPVSGSVYFTFEDAYNISGEDDLNDLVLRVANISMDEVEYHGKTEETYTWLICAEDLGTTDDFDFNDVILAATSLSLDGYSEVTFKAMAAGGTLPITLYFDPDKIYTDDDNLVSDIIMTGDNAGLMFHQGLTAATATPTNAEFHNWFDSGYSNTTMINTNDSKNGAKGKKCILYIADDDQDKSFTLSSKEVDETANSLADFYILVDDDSSSRVIKPTLNYSDAPQMFVILDHWTITTEDDEESDPIYYHWPIERKCITVAYPSFKTWLKTSSTEWYKNDPVANTTCRYN